MITVITLFLASTSLVLGILLAAVPTILFRLVGIFTLTSLETTLSRLAGCLFFSTSMITMLLTIRMRGEKCFNLRLALCYQAMLGLSLVLVGLYNNAEWNIEKEELLFESLLGCGGVFLLLSSLSLMATFWPVRLRSPLEERQPLTRTVGISRFFLWRRNVSSEDIEEPLLNDVENSHSNDETGSAERVIQEGQESIQYSNEACDSSRIQGTKRLIKLAAPQMGYLYFGCIVLLIRLPFSLSIPHFVSSTLGSLARSDYHEARESILRLFILGTVDAILDFWCVFLFGYAKERIVRGVRVDLLAAVLRQDVAFFDRNTTGDLVSRLSSDCGAMAGDLTWFFRFSIESVVRITGISIYMLVRCPTLGAYALSIVPVVAVVNKLYGNWLRENAIQVQDAIAEANSVAQEAFACVRTVIAFAAESSEHEKYSKKIEAHYRLNILQLIMTGIYYMVVSTFLINTLVQAALLLIGATLIEEGNLTTDILLAFMLYQGQLQSETMNLFNSYSSLIKSSGAGDKVFRLLDRIPPLPGTGNPIVLAHSAPEDNDNIIQSAATRNQSSQVEFRNIRFVYPTRPNQVVLKCLNLSIPAGSTMALVGPSGCGKSTIVSLLKRFYEPDSGNIFVDNKDLREVDVKQLRRSIGVVTQDPILFSGTILSNITYGCDNVSFDAAVHAATLANAHSFVSSFPDGYDTEVGERGIALSG
jgi:ABC-type multidrug transport system fused ATPase/permease subunit